MNLGEYDLQWQKQNRLCKENFRGLCVVNDDVIWASASHGTVMRSINGGSSWSVQQIAGAEELDFRDVHAFDKNTAMVLAAGDMGRIYRTSDGGSTWELVYSNDQKGIFFDGMDFMNTKKGIAFSDPIDGKIFLIKTENGGKTWKQIDPSKIPPALDGEAGYAASGTGIVFQENNVWIATGGGARARILKSIDAGENWMFYDTPMVSAEGSGIFSLAVREKNQAIIVGGSYMDSTNVNKNCAISSDGGESWTSIDKGQPDGYRSCVANHPFLNLSVAVGRTGCDYSTDNGQSWTSFSKEGYYVCGFSENYLWAMGRGGKMAKVEL